MDTGYPQHLNPKLGSRCWGTKGRFQGFKVSKGRFQSFQEQVSKFPRAGFKVSRFQSFKFHSSNKDRLIGRSFFSGFLRDYTN